MKRRLCRREAKRTVTLTCAKGTLHRAKPCFMSCFATRFMHRRCASLKKSHSLTRMAFFLAHPYKIDPYRKFFRNRSVFFGRLVDLSLGDDGSCTRPLSSGVLLHACKRSLCIVTDLNQRTLYQNSLTYESHTRNHQKKIPYNVFAHG